MYNTPIIICSSLLTIYLSFLFFRVVMNELSVRKHSEEISSIFDEPTQKELESDFSSLTQGSKFFVIDDEDPLNQQQYDFEPTGPINFSIPFFSFFSLTEYNKFSSLDWTTSGLKAEIPQKLQKIYIVTENEEGCSSTFAQLRHDQKEEENEYHHRVIVYYLTRNPQREECSSIRVFYDKTLLSEDEENFVEKKNKESDFVFLFHEHDPLLRVSDITNEKMTLSSIMIFVNGVLNIWFFVFYMIGFIGVVVSLVIKAMNESNEEVMKKGIKNNGKEQNKSLKKQNRTEKKNN